MLKVPAITTKISSASAVLKSGKLLNAIVKKFYLGVKITLEPFRAIVKAKRTRWVCIRSDNTRPLGVKR
jgi:hypothetical protein